VVGNALFGFDKAHGVAVDLWHGVDRTALSAMLLVHDGLQQIGSQVAASFVLSQFDIGHGLIVPLKNHFINS
jgi:hypothetical protein